MRLLFVTRKYPPSVGGMQRLSHHLVGQMKERAQVTAVTWGRTQRLLPVFLPYALARSITAAQRGIDLVHVGDPVVAPIGWILRRLFCVPVVVTVHGLDITLPFEPYQWFIPRLLRNLDRIVCISRSTRQACIDRGIPSQKCVVIRPGVEVPSAMPSRKRARQHIGRLLHKKIQGKVVLLTVGRLVPRKGVYWFVKDVLPEVLAVKPEVRYVIAGGGPDESRIRSATRHPALKDRAWALGQVSEEDLAHIYSAADLFIMPNLPVPGDLEGFGLVALEAAARGLPVLAADLEGIQDAVLPGHTGRLLEPGNPEAWAAGTLKALEQQRFRNHIARVAPSLVREHFAWGNMVTEYEDLFRRLVGEERP